ncbi:MAG TPA: NHL repeat-containing protein [Paludibaculum sp.]|jgi:streptogramin lyase
MLLTLLAAAFEIVTVAQNPFGLAIGPDGALYICEVGAHAITRYDFTTRKKSVFVHGNEPYELLFDTFGALLYVDRLEHTVRRVDLANGENRVLLGEGLNQPHALAWNSNGQLLICDTSNNRVVELDPATGKHHEWAKYRGARTFTKDARGNLYLALREGNAIMMIDGRTGEAARVASVGPKGMAWARDGSIYLADTENHRITRLNPKTGAITTVLEGLKRPHGVLVHDGWLYIGDSENNRVLRMRLPAAD